jgi:hypothetical protein
MENRKVDITVIAAVITVVIGAVCLLVRIGRKRWC